MTDAIQPLAMQVAHSDDARRERTLIRRAQAGDPHALQALVDQVRPVLHHLARRYSRGPQDLDDLKQVGALAAVKAIKRFEFDRSVRLESYLVPSVTGELRRHESARELGRMGSLTQASGIDDPEACVIDPGYGRCVQRAELSAAMRTLQPRERVAVGLAYLEERSQREIAATLGCSQMQVSRILGRAIGKLRTAMTQDAPRRTAA